MLKVEKKAIKVAIACMERRKKKAAFDKTLHDTFKEINPSAVNASAEWHELDEAIKIMKEMLNKDE